MSTRLLTFDPGPSCNNVTLTFNLVVCSLFVIIAWRGTSTKIMFCLRWTPAKLSTDIISMKKWVPFCKYLSYLHNTNTIVFNIVAAIRRTRFHIVIIIIIQISLFSYVIYISADGSVHDPKNKQQPNKLTLSIMMLERWNLVCPMAKWMGNTIVVIVWR